MSRYVIAGIKMDFEPQYPEFFGANLASYRHDYEGDSDHIIRTLLSNNIALPLEAPTERYPNRRVYQDDQGETIYAGDDASGVIFHKVWRSKSDREIILTINPSRDIDLAELEYVLTGILFFEIALRHGMTALHASAIQYQNQAILFSAPSGTGKSTQARLWKETYPECISINDDKPLLEPTNQGILIHGTPWSGKDVTNTNVAVPLKAIVFLEQGPTNILKNIPASERLRSLFRNTYRPKDPFLAKINLDLIEAVMNQAAILSYSCTADASAVAVLHDVLYGGTPL